MVSTNASNSGSISITEAAVLAGYRDRGLDLQQGGRGGGDDFADRSGNDQFTAGSVPRIIPTSFRSSPEHGIINPDNSLFSAHLKCKV
jgi:hypothetical protein